MSDKQTACARHGEESGNPGPHPLPRPLGPLGRQGRVLSAGFSAAAVYRAFTACQGYECRVSSYVTSSNPTTDKADIFTRILQMR